VDYSKVLTDRAKKQTRDHQNYIAVIRSDARCTGLSSEYFDHVLILGNSLGYIQLPDADSQILGESFRVLRPGGWLLVDIADGDMIRQAFKTDSWHETDGDMVICRYRELSNDALRAREMVLNKKKGLIRDETYAVRLYNVESLAALVENAGFFKLKIHTDFSPHKVQGDYGFMNCRMIATAQKP
jgi:D-alanine-D-alanine ligase